MIQFRGYLQTNGVTKSNVKEVIKKLLENAPKRKSGEKKTQMMQLIGLIAPILIKIWNCVMGIMFYSLILGRQLNSFSVRIKRASI